MPAADEITLIQLQSWEWDEPGSDPRSPKILTGRSRRQLLSLGSARFQRAPSGILPDRIRACPARQHLLSRPRLVCRVLRQGCRKQHAGSVRFPKPFVTAPHLLATQTSLKRSGRLRYIMSRKLCIQIRNQSCGIHRAPLRENPSTRLVVCRNRRRCIREVCVYRESSTLARCNSLVVGHRVRRRLTEKL
jgi:hypothetical protein